jgi:hypothetical protein
MPVATTRAIGRAVNSINRRVDHPWRRNNPLTFPHSVMGKQSPEPCIIAQHRIEANLRLWLRCHGSPNDIATALFLGKAKAARRSGKLHGRHKHAKTGCLGTSR